MRWPGCGCNERGLKRIVLLGGGHAHVQVLKALVQAPLPGCEVMLVSPFAQTIYSGMVPGWVAGHYTLEQCMIPLAPQAQAAGAQFVASSATAIEAGARRVLLAEGRRAEYDLLSIDIGSVMNRDSIRGAREHSLFVRPMEHFVQLLPGLDELAERRTLDVSVIGGGAAGVELAMALRHRFADTLAGDGVARARISLVTGGAPPLDGYPPRVMAVAQAALRERRISVLQEGCRAVAAGRLELVNGARVACDASIIATGGQAPPWLAGSGLALDAQGAIRTGATLQSVSHPEVLACGDAASRDDVMHPKSGVYAVRAAAPLMATLRALVGGVAAPPYRPPPRTLNLISCGNRRAIAAWGDWSTSGRWVWWWKDHIDRAFVARFRP